MNYYKRAIQIVHSGDAESILYAILADNPGAIVRAIDRPKDKIAEKKRLDLEARCLSLCKSGEKIAAIKLWRSETNVGLIEAKNAVEALVAAKDGE